MKSSSKVSSNRKEISIVKEYLNKLSDDDIMFMIQRIEQPCCGELASISSMFEKDYEIDKWLCQSKSAQDWFDRIDLIVNMASVELNKRQNLINKNESN